MAALGFPYSFWNETEAPFPSEACLHHLVVESAQRTPFAIALEQDDRRLTYRELNDASDAVAARLRRAGVRRESVVALLADHSERTVIEILAVLKAGAAYLPLDSNLPRDRIAQLLRKGYASDALNVERALVDESICRILDVGATASAQNIGATDQSSDSRYLDLAYVICTSGSTGEPKAIAVPHRGVVNNITDLNRRFAVGPGDRIIAVSSLGFDMSVYELLGTLIAGATIVLPPRQLHADPETLARTARERGVTIWNSAPALLQSVIEACERGGLRLPQLRLALFGGDWVPLSLPDRLRALAPEVRIIVMGGATEASIHSTLFEVGEIAPTWRSIPYGSPMANQRIYVLDEELRPVGVGEEGELFLAGTGLARGYLNQPAHTASRFVPNPFESGERMYRTGDRVRWQANGALELIGRIDHQVKIRGVRVELGELEAVLESHPAISRAIATVRGERLESKILRVAIQPKAPITLDEVMQFARDKLPPAMVPSEVVFVDAIPLSANGKVDRRAIAAMPAATSSHDRRPPRTALERYLADVWRDVLSIPEVGIEDDFFALGGHSLLLLRMAARLRERIGVQLSLRTLFNAPTIESLAAFILAEYPDIRL